MISKEWKIAKEKFYAAKKPIKNWDVNVENIVISKLVKIKVNAKYFVGYLDKTIRPLVLTTIITAKNAWFVTTGLLIMVRISRFCMQWLSWLDNVSANISNIAIITTAKNVGYCCIIYNFCKSEAINLLKISVLKDSGYI